MPDQPRHDPANVLDHATGRVRVLARRCATCIFRADDPMHLGPERIREVIEENLKAGALLTCHATLPYGDHPDFGPAVCAGFWARHRNAVPAGRLAQLALGTVRIHPPPHEPAPKKQQSAAPRPPSRPTHAPPAAHLHPDRSSAGPRPRRGDRIRLVATNDPYTALKPGALGTVTDIDSLGTIGVRWDNGSSLGLIPDLDQFDIIAP